MWQTWRTCGKVPDGLTAAVMNQVLYNLGTRGIEYDLIPWQREHGVPFYSVQSCRPGGRARNAGRRIKSADDER